MFVHLDDDHAVLSLHNEVHPGEASEVPVEPDSDLTSEINALSLQVALYAFLMDPDPLAPTACLMNVARATLAKSAAA